MTAVDLEGLDPSEVGLDAIDIRLLNLLAEDSRTSYADLGRALNLTRGAVRDRVRALVERGIIERFTIVVNPKKVGRSISAFFEIDVEPMHLTEVAAKLATNPYVQSVNQMTGPSTIHVHAALRDGTDLERFLRESVYSLNSIIMVRSYILLRSFKGKMGGLRIS